MGKETLEALKGSIKKWEDILDGKRKDLGGKNCPLCKLYFFDCSDDESCCNDCLLPRHCNGTPYEKWTMHQMYVHHSFSDSLSIKCKTCERHARSEIEYLKSFLPEG